MTFAIGDPLHVTDGHNALAMAVNDQLDRFGKGRTLKEDHLIGDPDHIGEHGKLIDALASIATAAGKSYTVPLPPKRQLGDGSHTADHNAMLTAVAEAASWPAWNSATGGDITDIPNYAGTGQLWRRHAWATNGDFYVSRATHPFRVLVVGGGDSGASWHHGWSWTPPIGADGAAILDDYRSLSTGSHPVVVAGPCYGPPPYDGCRAGGSSSFDGIVARAGSGVTTNIDGTSKPWPGNGYGIHGDSYVTSVDGSAEYGRHGGTGQGGIVIVAYRIG